MFRFNKRLLDQANPDGGAGGAAAGAGAAAAGAGAAAAGAGDSGAPAPGATTALGGAVNPHDWVPEKYRVLGADGKTLDLEASARKVAEGYGELHKKLVAGEGPPKDADAYEVKDLPNGLDFAALRKDPEMGAWLKGAHSKGMSNSQIQHVFSGLAKFLGADADMSAEDCVTDLRGSWKDDATFSANMKAADRAARQLGAKAGISFDDLNKAYGNDPKIVRLLAAIGAELKEDTSVAEAVGGGGVVGINDQIAAIDKQLLELGSGQADKRRALTDQKLALYEKIVKAKAA